MREIKSQMSLFDGSTPFKIDKPIRLIELFAGIGAQAAALERLQDEGLCTFEHYRICEFDRFAVKSYNLTPRECWRLMDFTDEQFDRAQKVNSDSQLYKQAGNSICVGVLVAIFRGLME